MSAQMAIRPRTWWKELPYLPILLALGIGMAVNNSKAVLEAVFGHQSSFVRTPKYGIGKADSRKSAGVMKKRGYKAVKSILVPLLELAFGFFFLAMIIQMVHSGKYISAVLMCPFLGFFYTSFCSLGKMIFNLIQTKESNI